jgi:hypothetical protein
MVTDDSEYKQEDRDWFWAYTAWNRRPYERACEELIEALEWEAEVRVGGTYSFIHANPLSRSSAFNEFQATKEAAAVAVVIARERWLKAKALA